MQALRQYGWFGLAAVGAVAALALQDGGPAGASLMSGLAAALAMCAGVIHRSARHGILATAMLCFGCNLYLFSRKLEGASGPSMCNVSDVVNCDAVNSSAASEMFGVPITLFGMGLYLGLAFATLYQARNTPRLPQVTALFAIVSLAYSAWLAYQSTVIGAVCVVCVTIYVGNALLLWAGLRGLEGTSPLEEVSSAITSNSFMTTAATFAVVVLVGASGWRDTSDATADVDVSRPDSLAGLYTATRGPVELDGTEPVLGNPNAPYLVVEWADFGCPHCARAERELHALVEQLPGQVQVRFRPFPLTAQCNPAMTHDGGPARCHAAAAAECAGQQGRFWDLAALIFSNQNFLELEHLAGMANQIGLDLEAWRQCMEDPATMDGLRADGSAGARAGVRGTPAMYLRGTHGPDFVEVPAGAGAILKLIEAHQSGTPLPPPGPPREM